MFTSLYYFAALLLATLLTSVFSSATVYNTLLIIAVSYCYHAYLIVIYLSFVMGNLVL